jgi:Flp pilus assembly protein TadB
MTMQRDLICSLILLGVAALYYALARELGETALSDAVGPAGLPLVYAAALAAFAVLLSVSAYLRRGRRATTTAADEPGPGRRLKRALGALAIGGVYIAVVPLIGYPPAMAFAIAAMAAYQGERLGWRLALIAVAGAGALFVLFELVLGVPMPAPWNA